MSKAYDKVRELIGQETEAITGPDKICSATIRHWCEAMQDGNPLYHDEDYAKKSKYKEIVAPSMMVQTCTMGPVWPEVKGEPNPLGKAVKYFEGKIEIEA